MFRKTSEPKKSDGFYSIDSGRLKMSVEELKRQKDIMEEKFAWPRRMLVCTGLIFFSCGKSTTDRPVAWRTARIIGAIVLIGLTFYQTCFILKNILRTRSYNLVMARGLIIFNWLLQALISMGFLLYWQFRGKLQRLKEDIHCPKGCSLTTKVIKRHVIGYLSAMIFVMVFSTIVIYQKFIGNKEAGTVFDDTIFEVYGTRKLFWIALIVHFWATYVWVAVLTFFVCVVTALQHELCAFNEHKLRFIGEDSEGDMEKIAEELQDLYMNHVELANRVRNIDNTFEVYTFTMIASNVPTSIVCLLSFLLSFQRSSLLGLSMSIPDLAFCLLELVALTSAPAKVHARIREVESIIYGNMRIWQPFNEKVYRLASVFISHANQSNLGITLWGFAVVTKPLILTMISLTVTYLTFLLQVNEDKDGKGIHGLENSTEFLPNITFF